ncbi:MAG: NAD(P)/FAD-dependent oxidoreductase [Desulfonatronovibrio sp.]
MDKYDVAVIGGGPAGLMAAGQAGARGLKTILLEKMHQPARKLGITGKGRCNLTNSAEHREFLKSFGSGAKFMRFALGRFDNKDLIEFFNTLGVETIIERGGRVFPSSQKAQTIVRSLVNWTKKQGVTIRCGSTAEKILTENGQVSGIVLKNNKQPGQEKSPLLSTNNVIISTGGYSYPSTGSTGDGYRLAQSLGHEITGTIPALVPLETSQDTARKMQGLSLRNVQAEIFVQGKKQDQGFGEMLFTHFGVSGPIILTMSKTAVQALNLEQNVLLSIDLKPAVSHAQLKNRIARVMHQQGKKQLANILKEFLPLKMIPVFLEKTGLNPDKQGNKVTAEEQKILRLWCKELQIEISGYRSFKEAVITSGGVKLSQVNPRTMESRIIKGLYFAGEVLDIDADTGGYNLQAAFSTGWVAGRSADI